MDSCTATPEEAPLIDGLGSLDVLEPQQARRTLPTPGMDSCTATR
jgi:hypothetical protein